MKYRGKTLDCGEWVYGFYLETEYYRGWIIESDFEIHSELSGNPVEDLTKCYAVDIGTVGVCSDVRDESGTFIYENDIISHTTIYMDDGEIILDSENSIVRFENGFFGIDVKLSDLVETFLPLYCIDTTLTIERLNEMFNNENIEYLLKKYYINSVEELIKRYNKFKIVDDD